MKNIALGAAFVLTFMSWSAVAAEQEAAHGQPPTEEQCKAMAEQHGMKGNEADAWVEKCMAISDKMKSDRGMGENDDTNDMSDGNDMQDPEDGDSGMSGETK